MSKKTFFISLLISILISAILTAILWLIPGVGGCAIAGILPGVLSFWGLNGLYRKQGDGKRRITDEP